MKFLLIGIKSIFYALLFNLFFISICVAKNYQWYVVSGRWEQYILDSGNKVMRQSWAHDFNENRTAIPYIRFQTIRIHPQYTDPSYATTAKFDFNIQSFYSSYGELAVFFGGASEKELYFIRILFHKNLIYNISLCKSFIKNPEKPLNVFGNYDIKYLDSRLISIPTLNVKELKVERSANGIRVYLDQKEIFNYAKSEKKPWIFYPKTFFAIGSRGTYLWIDNIIISRKGKILFKDDFSNDNVKRIYFKIRNITTKDNSTPTSPR
jgi:hypothetical protein